MDIAHFWRLFWWQHAGVEPDVTDFYTFCVVVAAVFVVAIWFGSKGER